ncbi:extracellular solute-binding protein [Neorhizobium sp. P12A]|uniref:ABC transporter substrate-binding protein n=1 Tax=Neorhizobium sp. P12A TaxID=2268027 RepID=UPI00165E4FC5|nr:extracellular solute-binding protein [Neorhizobium sp. P12A]
MKISHTMARCLRGVAAVALMAASFSAGTAYSADQSLVDAAVKEGHLTYATNMTAPETQKVLEKAFRETYKLPDSFQIEGYTADSSGVVARVGQEMAADKVSIDWVAVNSESFWRGLAKKGALLEYCSESYKTLVFLKQAKVLDGGCYFQAASVIVFGVMWNPAYVSEDITSWAQLADPKYKGQIIIGDARKSAGYLDQYAGLRQANVWTDEWLQKMKAQDPFFVVRSTDIRDRVMSGEFPIAIFGFGPRAYQVRDQVPLKMGWPSEGIVATGSYGGVLAKAPHPNAGKLWTDFIFSEKGQEILVEQEGISSIAKVKVPDDAVPFIADVDKIKTVTVDWDAMTQEALDKWRSDFRRVFGE